MSVSFLLWQMFKVYIRLLAVNVPKCFGHQRSQDSRVGQHWSLGTKRFIVFLLKYRLTCKSLKGAGGVKKMEKKRLYTNLNGRTG